MATHAAETDLVTFLTAQQREVEEMFTRLEQRDHELAEHQQAEQTMTRLEALGPADRDFWPTVHQLISEVRHHLREEENDLFPRLTVACPVRELRELGRKVEQAEKVAPTRPHPSKPSEGAPLAAVTPVAGLVDRMRDALSGRGH